MGMAEVMAPSSTPAPMSLSPEPEDSAEPQAIPRPRPNARDSRIPSYAENRMSSYSKRNSRSRPQSNVFPPFPSSLSYALVRDFAYPSYHPMHYGAPPEPPSGTSTPGSDWNTGRRMSESAEASLGGGRGSLIAGPWGGDGAVYGDPDSYMDPLPSTAFGSAKDDWDGDEASFKKNKHRKSKSFTESPNYERGRRRESGTKSADYSLFAGGQSQYDPAGRGALRQSRGFAGAENGEYNRRDSHLHNATTSSNSRFHTSHPPMDPDEQIPLDAEPSGPSPQRESLGPEDEDLFAGPSLALYSFEPENDNELRLIEGQTIMVSYRHGQGWLVAENPQTGEQGLVPEQYVRLLRDIEGWDEEKGGFVDDDELLAEHAQLNEAGNGNGVPDTTTAGDDLDYDVEMKKLSIKEQR